MRRKSILGIILFFLTLALTILHGSLIDKYIQNNQLSNQIKEGTIQQIYNLDLENSCFDISPEFQFIEPQNFHNTQTVIPRKNQPRLKSISTSPPQPTYEAIDILWILLCSGLVFIMQPGFMCLESGLTRSKNSINVAIKNLTDFGISVTCFWSFGFAFMFGASSSGIIGHSKFFLATDLQAFDAAFFLFQLMFCGTATTIVSGAVAERMKYSSYLFVASLVSGLVYPIFGHWVWNGADIGILTGWLGHNGFVDFAGSSVVHSIGGWVSLATLLVIGPRTGRFPPGRPPEKIHGSNLPLSVLGAMLIWFGWFGFNGGSTLALNEQVAGIIVNTILASAAGMIITLGITWYIRGIPSVEGLINGTLSGLVGITAACHAVTAFSAILIGIISAIVTMLVEQALEKIRVDDAVGAIPVHLGAGIWGTLAVAFFGKAEVLDTGLSFSQQLTVQLLGILAAFLLGFCLVYPILFITNKLYLFRVSEADENIGLNVSEHQAKTEILDLFRVMDSQARTQDLSLRVPVEPFTEVGQIAERYNQVMNALEEVTARNDAIIKVATDAIITFTKPELEIISINPSGEKIFAYKNQDLVGKSIYQIFDFTINPLTLEKMDADYLLMAPEELIEESLKLWVNPNFIAYSTQEFIDYCYVFDLQDIQPENWQFPFPSFLHLLEENLVDSQTESETQKKINKQIKYIELMISKIAYSGNLYELVGIRADGSLFPMEIAVREAKFNQKTFYTGTFRDITDRKESEIKLKENEQRFRSLSRATFEGIIIHEQEKIMDTNIAAANMFGYELSEMVGMSGWELIVPEYHDLIVEKMTSGSEKAYEVIGVRKDGSTFPLEVESKVFLYRGNQNGVAALRDITERKLAEAALRESEERFRAVMEQAADAFIIHDLEGKIIDVNQSTCKSLGYSRQELLNLYVEDIEENFVYQGFPKKWKNLILGRPMTIEGIHRRKNRTTFPVEIRLGLLKAGNGKLILALCRDITERKKAETALLLEREKSEKLLLNILPKPIADRLKEGDSTIAEGFAEVTVLFADLVGFTELAGRATPQRLVYWLNEIFSRFDLLAEKYGLEKIKTIGDAYMVVGGLPDPMENHAEAIALMAIDMLQEVAHFADQQEQNFNIRIGINTGPVVAGVIGRKKFIYDLWGDTVNIASRMESHGIPGVIQVTEDTYQILQHKFLFAERGLIDIKGKGYMKAYILREKKKL
ncbi:ammonium transporter [Okeania sp. SIO2B3]|uniref:ammonium transporter n=1 Tax=Okeania sp. SIO2B3 TaxID=2607784 RepID=UPI0013C0D28A|nr:ammonium transporter [Okeania sp. SIO2B3]NET43534.1 ammonium transporter [Okeania sp. SIO2B3]